MKFLLDEYIQVKTIFYVTSTLFECDTFLYIEVSLWMQYAMIKDGVFCHMYYVQNLSFYLFGPM
jgi:hypothetical protein